MRVPEVGCRSSLCHPVPAFAGRQGARHGGSSPRLPGHPTCATPEPSPMNTSPAMPKAQRKIDRQNPFIPARSPICRAAETALIFSITAAGLAAALAAILCRTGG